MPAYSLLDVSVSIDGPGGMFAIDGTGLAEEGINIEPVGDLNTMTAGGDGEVMHSLSAAKTCTVTIKLLKTSPTNARLMSMCNFQRASSARHGMNAFIVRDSARGDLHVVSEAAFKKVPPIGYAKEGGLVEWVFDGGKWEPMLGGESVLDLLL